VAESKRKPSDKVAAAFAKFPAPTAQAAEGICKDLLGGGKAVVDELLALVGEAFGDARGVKAKYALHGMALYAGRPGAPGDRKTVAAALAAHLGANHSEDLKAFVCRQLQFCGRADDVQALATLLDHERLCEPAAQALAAIGGAKAAAALKDALGSAKGKRRVTIITALGFLADGHALPTIRQAATDDDRDVRLAALYALANACDALAVEICIKAPLQAKTPFERSQAFDACLLLARRMKERERGRTANAILARMAEEPKSTWLDHEWHAIRQARGK